MHAALYKRLRTAAAIALLVLCVRPAGAYSVLTHEQIVDIVWLDNIKPMLLERFPSLTADELRHAHAFAYGGSVIQDLGFYLGGNKFFSDLTHYVRSGDFVAALIRNSLDANEYAFALGALAHYCSDINGHPAVNRATAIEYPKLRAKYGPVVTYDDSPAAHIETEFGFDVVQIAKTRYTSQQYHDFIGFEVSESLLERTFSEIYGLPLRDVLVHEGRAIGSYRWAVGQFIPKLTQAALTSRRAELTAEEPNFDQQKFLYHLSRAEYEREWGRTYQRPSAAERMLGVIVKGLGHLGLFKGAAFHNPDAKTEDLYMKSVNLTVERYKAMLTNVRQDFRQENRKVANVVPASPARALPDSSASAAQARQPANWLQLRDIDLDTGKAVAPGEYKLTDETYAELVHQISEAKWALSPDLRFAIVRFYANHNAPLATKSDREKYQQLQAELKPIREGRQ